MKERWLHYQRVKRTSNKCGQQYVDRKEQQRYGCLIRSRQITSIKSLIPSPKNWAAMNLDKFGKELSLAEDCPISRNCMQGRLKWTLHNCVGTWGQRVACRETITLQPVQAHSRQQNSVLPLPTAIQIDVKQAKKTKIEWSSWEWVPKDRTEGRAQSRSGKAMVFLSSIDVRQAIYLSHKGGDSHALQETLQTLMILSILLPSWP